jgi:nitronate monooxygenase
VAICTRLTRRLSISHPILNAAMGATAGGALAAAVSAAGGLGMIGLGTTARDFIEREFLAAGDQRVGCGFITWELARQPSHLDAALELAPAAVLLSFGDPAPYISKIKQQGLPVICQVQTVALAREALHLGADIIVAQGAEAGGHGGSRGTVALVPAVVDAAAKINPEAIVLAAGGIADGRGLAAMLMLGADGVMIGTRFHVAREALTPAEAKARIISGGGDDTFRGRTFDIARDREALWGADVSLRSLANDFTREWHGRDAELTRDAKAKTRYVKAFQGNDYALKQVLCGEAIDLINDGESAGTMVENIMAEAEAALARRNRA